MFNHQRFLLEVHDLYVWQIYHQEKKKNAIGEQPNNANSKE